jgi:molybdenum cofactor biosynthesis enzyme MoaA
MLIDPIRHAAKRVNRTYREVRMVAKALRSGDHPVLAHIVVTRRCNLACTYCSEFDDFSKPVPKAEMFARIDKLAELGTTVVTMTGGETLLHPDLDQIIARVRSHGIVAILVSNGYLLNVERIRRLNRAGLDHMQISVDNVQPDEVSKKSLKVLDQRLQWLAQHAEFRVSIHSVLGACKTRPQDALVVARRATELGLISTAGIVHDETGRLQPLNAEQRDILQQIDSMGKRRSSAAWHNPWRKNLINGQPNDWHCGGGGRHLYICENGLVHLCMAQRGYPGIPLAQYTREDIRREGQARKSCTPYCTIFCIQRVALIDRVRENPRQALEQFFPTHDENGNPRALPMPIRLLSAVFAPKDSPGRANAVLQKTALKILKVD